MNGAQDLVWLPTSLGGALGDQLHRLLAEKAASWHLPPPGDVQAALLAGDGTGAAEPEGSLDLMADDTAALRTWLSEQLMGSSWPESAIVDRAMRQLLHALTNDLRQCFGTPQAELAQSAGRACPGHRGVRLQLNWAGQALYLQMGTAQLTASGWLKPPHPARLAPIDLAAALSTTAVPLRATLGHVDLPLSDWLHLSSGDVLLLDKPLSEPLTVQVPGSDWRQQAQLGANVALTHRTLRWISA